MLNQPRGPRPALKAPCDAGAIVAASTDLTFNLYGYASVGLNDFLTALYLVMVKKSPATQGLTTTGLLFYNAVLSMPALALALVVSGEAVQLAKFPDMHRQSFRVWLRQISESIARARLTAFALHKDGVAYIQCRSKQEVPSICCAHYLPSLGLHSPKAFMTPLRPQSEGGWCMQATLMLSCVLGLTINHSTFVCTRYNDPLTTSVAGNLKNLLMTAVGVFAFGDFFFHRWNTLGICISMAGAIWYATKAALRVRSYPYQSEINLFKFGCQVHYAWQQDRTWSRSKPQQDQ